MQQDEWGRRSFLGALLVWLGVGAMVQVQGQTFINRSEELGVAGGSTACWFDMNNDGWVDVLVGGTLYRNLRGQSFAAVGDFGACVAGDFDNDGLTDLFAYGGAQVYRNIDGQSFEALAMPDRPAGAHLGAALCDLNGDGYLDVYVGGYEAWPSETHADFILHNRAGRVFSVTWSEVRYRARGVTACDYDRDADVDIYVSNYRLQPNVLWQNQGDYTFLDKAAEFNALATDRGFGGGHSIGSCWGDFNDDGHIDLFAGNFAHNDGRGHQPESHCLLNRGPEGNYHFEDLGQRGVFYQESYASPSAGDFDNDGDLDLFFTTVYGVASFGVPNNPVLFQNDGSFNFGNATGAAGLGGLPATYQAAWADFDNDGDLDLMAGGSLFENQGGTGNSWLKVTLEGDGRTVNRSAIGAQVRIPLPGGRILTRHVEAGTGQGNQNELTLHFGLGTHRAPVNLEIFWPDGTSQLVENVALNQRVTYLREPLVEIVRPSGPMVLEVGASLHLDAARKDDEVTVNWSVESAPPASSVAIADRDALQTEVRFYKPGEYQLRVTGRRAGIVSFQNLMVVVVEDGLQSRPAAWWKFDDGAGTTLLDSTEWNQDGRLLGYGDGAQGWLEEGAGAVAGALSFDPASMQYVDLGRRVHGLVSLDAGTLAVWLRSSGNGERPIFQFTSPRSGDVMRWILRDGFLHFENGRIGVNESTAVRWPVPLNDNQWHHAALTCDRSGVATLYLDGELVSYGRVPFLSAVGAGGQLQIGSATGSIGAPVYFSGALDDLRIYPEVLDSHEVARLSTPPTGATPAPRIVLPAASITSPGSILALDAFPVAVEEGVIRWEQREGPGTVEFSDPGQNTGTVTFPLPGTYRLRIISEASSVTTSRELTVIYAGGAAGAPASIEVGDRELTQARTRWELELAPIFADPDHDDSELNYSVNVAGEGGELFESATVVGGGLREGPLRLALLPRTGAEGEAMVQIVAVDPDGNQAATEFKVTISNSPPLVLGASFALDENVGADYPVGRLVAVDPDGDEIRYRIVSGNVDQAFALDPLTGELTVRNPEAVDFEYLASFELGIAVTDESHPIFDRPVAVRVTINNLPEPPVLENGRILLGDRTVDSVVGQVSGSALDGGALTYELVGGDPAAVFALEAGSGQLTLVNPGGIGTTRRYQLLVRATDGEGRSTEATIEVTVGEYLLAEGADARWKVPVDDSEDAQWRTRRFNDRNWTESPTGLGYDRGPTYVPLIASDLGGEMDGVNTTVYVRQAFQVADPEVHGPIFLRMRYDDGFLAYLNGQLVAGRHAPDDPDWKSEAVTSHDDNEAVKFQEFTLGLGPSLLRPGTNVLAIHGLNHLLSSSDFLLTPELLAGPPLPPVEILPEGGEVRFNVPLDDTDDEFWTERDFDDSAWRRAPMGLGYDDTPDYDPHIARDVTAEMQGVNTGIYARARFQVPDPSRYRTLNLEMKYDDGFVAFFNGLYAVSSNAPGLPELAWNSVASADHGDAPATSFSSFPLPHEPDYWLVEGENILMLHGLNIGITSSDFLISARLVGRLADAAGGPATMFAEGASELEGTQARVNGSVVATGGLPVHVFAVYGRRDHGTDIAAWPYRAFAGSVEVTGRVSPLLRNLEPGASYSVRFYAQRIESGEIAGWSGPVNFVSADPELRFVESGGPVQILVPESAEETIGWQEKDFTVDPARWLDRISPVGFDVAGSFQVRPFRNVVRQMFRQHTSALLRFPFVVGRDAEIDSLTLRMKYDDGFVAYLNGVEIARSNAGANVPWDASASAEQNAGAAEIFEEFDVSDYARLLRPGPNVLAVHGLNWSAADPEFLIGPELVAKGFGGYLSPLDTWLFDHEFYGGEADPSADPDHDGRSQVEEFAAVRLLEFQAIDNDALLLSYERRPGLQDDIQLSEDLVNWWPALPAGMIRESLGDGEFERVTHRLLTPSAANDKLFVRVLSTVVLPGVVALPEGTLLDETAIMHALVPDSPVPRWTGREFDHSLWVQGPARAGFEDGEGYEPLIDLDLAQAMSGVNTSVYLRVPFTVDDPDEFQSLTLRMKYDDGFVAYLNGVPVAAVNDDPNAVRSWQAGATTTHDDPLAVEFEEFDLTGFLAALVPGQNVLAIHGLNAGLASSDFLIIPELVATTSASPQPQAPLLPPHYARWALMEGLSGSDANLAADPDDDQTGNLAEFALGGDPSSFDRAVTSPQLSRGQDGGQVEVTFRRRAGLNGASVEVEHSLDLLTWEPPPGLTEVAVVPLPGGLVELVTLRFPVQGEAGFVRLRVSER
jgi:hypothetical protein